MHLRVDHSDEDAQIAGLIAAAAIWMDGWTGVPGRCILTQIRAVRVADPASMRLPFPDVQSAVLACPDADGISQPVDLANYRVRKINGAGWLTLADTFSAHAVLSGRDDAVTVTAAHGSATLSPALRNAALMLVGHWYQQREGAGDTFGAFHIDEVSLSCSIAKAGSTQARELINSNREARMGSLW